MATSGGGWKEVVSSDEQKMFEGFARRIEDLQRAVARRHGEPAPARGFHAKIHAGLRAEFRVLADLPPKARFGVFSEPRVFPAVVRFSNGESSAMKPDPKRQPRGIAIKLIGVAGPKLPSLPDEDDALTQDFLATSHSVTSTVRNVQQFFAFIDAMERGVPGLWGFVRTVGVWEAARILRGVFTTILLSDVRSMATEHFSSTAPIRCGPHAVKFTVRPAEGTAPAERLPRTDHFLKEELSRRLRRGDVVLDFVIQFYVDDVLTPIEDTSIPWNPVHSPFLKVAQLRIPSCDLDDPEVAAVGQAVNRLAFTPWHATEEHRPLGNVMRARKIAYQASSKLRRYDPEPTGLPL